MTSRRQACLKTRVSYSWSARNLDELPEFRARLDAVEGARNSPGARNSEQEPPPQLPDIPEFVTSLPASRRGPEPLKLDLLAREQFLELLRTGFRKHLALRTMQVYVRTFQNTLDAEPEFRREVWDAENERREMYHTVLHSAAVGGQVVGDTDVARFLYREEIKIEELEEAQERRREAREPDGTIGPRAIIGFTAQPDSDRASPLRSPALAAVVIIADDRRTGPARGQLPAGRCGWWAGHA